MSLRKNRVSIHTLQRAVESLKVNEHDDINTDDPRNFDPNAGDKAIDANTSEKVGEIEQAPVPPKSEQISRENADADGLEDTLSNADVVDASAVTQTAAADQQTPADEGLASVPATGTPTGEQSELVDGVSVAGEGAVTEEGQYVEGVSAHAEPAVAATEEVSVQADPVITDAATEDPGVTAAIAEGEVAPTGEVAAMTDELATDPDAVVGDQAGSAADTTVVVDTSSDDPINAPVVDETTVTVSETPEVTEVTETTAEVPAVDPNAEIPTTEQPGEETVLSTESSEGSGRDPIDTDNKAGTTEVGTTGGNPGIPDVAPANGNDPSGEVKDREPTPGNSGQDLSEKDIGVITDPTIDENLSVEALQAALLTLEETSNELDYVSGRMDMIEKCQEMGGMEPEMASEMQTTLESLSRRLRIPLKDMNKQMPSLENFSYGVSSRLRATSHTLESFKEFYTVLKDRLIKALNWFGKYFSDNYTDLMQRLGQVSSRLADVKSKVAKANFPAQPGTVNSPNLARRLNIGGKVPANYSEVAREMFTLAQGLANMSGPIRSGDFLRQVARTVQGGEQARSPSEIIEGLTGINQVPGMRAESQDGAIVYQSRVFFGNKQAYVSIPEGDWTNMDVQKLNAGVRDVPAEGEADSVITLPTRSDCLALITYLQGINGLTAQLRRNANEIKQLSSKTNTFLSRMGNEQTQGGNGEETVDRQQMGTTISAIQRLITLAGEPLVSYSRYVYVASNDLISVIEGSLKQSGEAAPAAEPEAAPAA